MPSRAPGASPRRRGSRTLLYLPAYNAARTLERTLSGVTPGEVDEVLLVDDGSHDETLSVARRFGLRIIAHAKNQGYGASQKTAYRAALSGGFDQVVMLHPDTQHDARLLPYLLGPVQEDIYDIMLGSRIRTRTEALAGGMPLYKYISNRVLTLVQNVATGQNFSEWHTGFRVYHRRVLEAVPFEQNSDDFAFDSEMLLQAVTFGFRVGEIPVPVRYGPGASSIRPAAAARYALATLAALGSCFLHRCGINHDPRWRPAGPREWGSDRPMAGERSRKS